MSLSSQKNKNMASPSQNHLKISSLRSKLSALPGLAEQFDSFIDSYNASMESSLRANAGLQSTIKSMLANLKQVLSDPAEWMTAAERVRGKQRQAALLLDSKMYQTHEIYHAIAANSILVDTLTIIKNGTRTPIDTNHLPIHSSKRELLNFYREVCQFYRWKDKKNKAKNRSLQKAEDILQAYPQLNSCSLFRQQMQETVKRNQFLLKINDRFSEIEQKLLGFALEGSQASNLQEISVKLQKLLVYVKESYHLKDSHKITPKNVKEHNEIIHILSLLANSNLGLLQELIDRQNNQQIKSACNRLLQNIQKNSRVTDSIYEFLAENIDQKNAFKFARSVKQLPLDRKLTECEKLLKQMKHLYLPISETEKQKSKVQASKLQLHQQTLIQELNSKILESNNQQLLIQQQIYTLSAENRALQKENLDLQAQKQQLAASKYDFEEKLEKMQSQHYNSQELLSKSQARYEALHTHHKTINHELETLKLDHHLVSAQLLNRQDEVLTITAKIIQLTDQLNQIRSEKQQIITKINNRSRLCKIQPETLSLRVEPCAELKNFEEVINFIEDAPLNINNTNIHKTPSTPSSHKRERCVIKHSRSLSNVDFLSELMPELPEKEIENDNLEATLDSEELRKGIQLREKTIKKYEIYMEKQRKEAKKLRSEILDLEAKIRSLELEQIKLRQMVEDQSSEKYLQIDEEEEGYSSLIHIEDGTEKKEEIKSIEKIAEKQVELKVKEQELNFKIEEIIKHVLKLNTLKVSSQNSVEGESDTIAEELIQETQINPENKAAQERE